MVSTNIDLMHSVLLGFVKKIFIYWFDHPLNNAYSLKLKINLINEKLLSCTPQSYIPQAPRRIEDFHKWRAHEFLNFILYFAIPVFLRNKESRLLSTFITFDYIWGRRVAEAGAVPFILRRFKFSMRKSIKGEYNEAILACLVYLIRSLIILISWVLLD